MPGFWDASAIVPLCTPLDNSGLYRRLLRQHSPVVWWGTAVEVLSAICRLRREKLVSLPHQDAANRRLALLRKTWREVQPTSRLRDLAETCLERHELRAADSLQLAAALIWCNQKPRNRAFVCRDARLREAARREGFAIIEL